MGLLSTEVEVKLHPQNIYYFENLGYEIPRIRKCEQMRVKRGTTIVVKTKDLKPTSTTLVDVECDCCKKILNIKYGLYVKCNHDGKYYCIGCTGKIFRSRENNSKWNPNLTDEEREIGRDYPEYNEFVRRVLARDKYTCQCCKKRINNKAEVHHLDGYNWCIEKRTDETNGVTLCFDCHANFHSKYGKGNNTKEQYEEWIGYAIGELKKYDGKLPIARKVFDYERNEIFESAQQYADIFNVYVKNVRKCCNHKELISKRTRKDGTVVIHKTIYNTVNGHHLFWLNEYENMTEDEINYYINKRQNNARKNICITTGEIFDSLEDAVNKYDIYKSVLSKCCNKEVNYCGKLPDGTKLMWMSYEDFLQLPLEEQNEILNKNKESSSDGSFVI